MERTLSRIEDGSFAKEWTKEYKKGMTFLKKNQEKISKHKIESAWKKMRKSSKG